jgi:RNA polymerase sigma factor (sigma-70 family)
MDYPHGFHDLLRRAQAGDQQAFEEVLAIFQPWLNQQAQGRGQAQGPNEGASDLAQEAWLRAWQNLDQFQGAGDDEQTYRMFRAWLKQIVQRLGLNMVRERNAQHRKPPGRMMRLERRQPGESSKQGAVEPATNGASPSSAAAADEQAEQIRGALERIADPSDREIMRLRFFEGLSFRQIAVRLHDHAENVRQRFHAILRRLERDLKGLS